LTTYRIIAKNAGIHYSDEPSIEANIGKIMDYFKQLECTEELIHSRGPLLVMVFNVIIENIEFFDREHFVVLGSQNGPPLVKTSLFQAFHEHFSQPGFFKEITLQQIVCRAKRN